MKGGAKNSIWKHQPKSETTLSYEWDTKRGEAKSPLIPASQRCAGCNTSTRRTHGAIYDVIFDLRRGSAYIPGLFHRERQFDARAFTHPATCSVPLETASNGHSINILIAHRDERQELRRTISHNEPSVRQRSYPMKTAARLVPARLDPSLGQVACHSR
jgi:hypothetical protein